MSEMKVIPGFNGVYEVSKDGKVWSNKSNKYLKPHITKRSNGKSEVLLYQTGGKGKYYAIEDLIEMAFVGKSESSNNVDALAIVETVEESTKVKKGKAVYCVELDKEYASMADAARELKLNYQSVQKMCNKVESSAGNVIRRITALNGYHLILR